MKRAKYPERVGRKVIGLKYCLCEPVERRWSNLIQCHNCSAASFLCEWCRL